MSLYMQQRDTLPEDIKPFLHEMDMRIWAWHRLGNAHIEKARTACIDVLRRLGSQNDHVEMAWLYRMAYGHLEMLYGQHPNPKAAREFDKWLTQQERKRGSVWWGLVYSIIGT